MADVLTCCGEPVAKSQSKTTGVCTLKCKKCGTIGAGNTPKAAEAQFLKNREGTSAAALPTQATALPTYVAEHMPDMRAVTIPFIAQNRPALTRLIKNNIRHIMTQKDQKFLDCWKTAEGQESIIHALEEALMLGAELGKMGSLVPYGGIIEFIPAVEAFEFALTHGNNPPFGWIHIDLIHEHDIIDMGRVNGVFHCKIKQGMPRGELVGVAVYGFNNRLGQVIGESYEKDRLLAKARIHSVSYKYYLQDKRTFQQRLTEGKVKTDTAGREYIAEERHKKGGGTWTKKIYADEIINPYEGADQPEMLRKAAGKTFLGKYARVRNAEAAIDEITPEDNVDQVVEASIDAAFSAFETERDDPTAEDITPDEPDMTLDEAAESFGKKNDDLADKAENMSEDELQAAIAREDAKNAPPEPATDSLMGKVKKQVDQNREGNDQEELY